MNKNTLFYLVNLFKKIGKDLNFLKKNLQIVVDNKYGAMYKEDLRGGNSGKNSFGRLGFGRDWTVIGTGKAFLLNAKWRVQ